MCLGVLPGLNICQCFRNEFEYTETPIPTNTSCNMILPDSMDFVCKRSRQVIFQSLKLSVKIAGIYSG